MDSDRRRTLRLLAGLAAPAALGWTPGVTSAPAPPDVPSWVPAGVPPLYFDKHGLIVQRDQDGGDTAQREGFAWFGFYLLKRQGIDPGLDLGAPWETVLRLLEVESTAEFRRHPDPGPGGWWNRVDHFSRDQQTPLVAALGALGPRPTLARLWAAFQKRGRRCQNGEPGSVDHQNLFRRALGVEKVQALGETQLAGMVESIRARGMGNTDDVGDDLNFIVNLAAAQLWPNAKANTVPPPNPAPTPSPTIGRIVGAYVRTRPINRGCYLVTYRQRYKDVVGPDRMNERLQQGIHHSDPAQRWQPDCHPIVGALRWYFRPETGAGWGLAALYEQVVSPWIARNEA